MKEKKQNWSAADIAYIGVMAAIVLAVTEFRLPLGESKVHLANGFCLLAGMLLGPLSGGLAAGIGSAIYDAHAGYDVAGVLITFVSKFAMAWVCGKLMPSREEKGLKLHRTVLASVAGALTYVALYMLKTYVYQRIVYQNPLNAVAIVMWGKLIPSLINALAAVIIAPILYHALRPALRALKIRQR